MCMSAHCSSNARMRQHAQVCQHAAGQLRTLSWSMCLQAGDTWSRAYRSVACTGNKCSPKGASGQFTRCIAYAPNKLNETAIEPYGLLHTSFSALLN